MDRIWAGSMPFGIGALLAFPLGFVASRIPAHGWSVENVTVVIATLGGAAAMLVRAWGDRGKAEAEARAKAAEARAEAHADDARRVRDAAAEESVRLARLHAAELAAAQAVVEDYRQENRTLREEMLARVVRAPEPPHGPGPAPPAA